MLTIDIFGILTHKKNVLSSSFWSCLEDRDKWQVRGKIKRHRVCVEQRLAALGDSQWDIAVIFLSRAWN